MNFREGLQSHINYGEYIAEQLKGSTTYNSYITEYLEQDNKINNKREECKIICKSLSEDNLFIIKKHFCSSILENIDLTINKMNYSDLNYLLLMYYRDLKDLKDKNK
jgi:hypothetical protein